MAHGGASSSSAIKQVKLEKESELRIEVGNDASLRLRLLNGTAEIFGTELAPEIWLTFPPRLKFAVIPLIHFSLTPFCILIAYSILILLVFYQVFTWYGATIEMEGTTETDYTADEVNLYL